RVSGRRWTAVCSFSNSSSILLVTAELPMLALILHAAATPMAIGSNRFCRWTVLAGITMRPRATSARINSGSSSSRRATKCMASVIVFARAASNWVMSKPSGKRSGRHQPRGVRGQPAPQAEQPAEQEQGQPRQSDVEEEHAQRLQHVLQAEHPEQVQDGQRNVEGQQHQLDDAFRLGLLAEFHLDDEAVAQAEEDERKDGEAEGAEGAAPPEFGDLVIELLRALAHLDGEG